MSTTLTERQLGRAVEQNKKYIYLQNETASDGDAGLHHEPGGGHIGRRTFLCVLGRYPAAAACRRIDGRRPATCRPLLPG